MMGFMLACEAATQISLKFVFLFNNVVLEYEGSGQN